MIIYREMLWKQYEVMHVDKFFSQGSATQYAQAQDSEMQKKFNYPLHIQEGHKLIFI